MLFVDREGAEALCRGEGVKDEMGGGGVPKTMPVPQAGGNDIKGTTVPATATPSSGLTSHWAMPPTSRWRGVRNTLEKAFDSRLTPTANMRNPRAGPYIRGVNQAKEAGCTLQDGGCLFLAGGQRMVGAFSYCRAEIALVKMDGSYGTPPLPNHCSTFTGSAAGRGV